MNGINLLPWRENLRKVRNRVFFALFGATVFFALIVVGIIHFMIDYRINVQKSNIAYLTEAQNQIKNDVKEIQGLQENKKELLNRMQIIQSLREDRNSIVILLDKIVKMVPEGIYLTEFSRKVVEAPLPEVIPPEAQKTVFPSQAIPQKPETPVAAPKGGYVVMLSGHAETNASISVFLKSLEEEPLFNNVKLNEISIDKQGVGLNFILEFHQG